MNEHNWDDASGRSEKDILLAEIETMDIVLLVQKLSSLKESGSYLERYIEDRKREAERTSQSEEESIVDAIYRVFSTKKLTEEDERRLSQGADIWYKMSDDPDIIEAIQDRIERIRI